ncbi:putative small lipoprotein YifL [Sporosarcina luteola]|nr:putative small lipoprotein YifL [Sporosarcina luteola]
MKKLLMVLMMAFLVMALAACGDDKKDNGKAEGTGDKDNTEQTEGTDNAEDTEGTEAASGDVLADEYYKNIVDILKDAGYEVDNVQEADTDFFVDAKSSMKLDINGENILPLQVYEIDPDSESLKTAQETGLAPAQFEGQTFEQEGVEVIGNHYFFLAEGHPNQADVIKLLQEKLK